MRGPIDIEQKVCEWVIRDHDRDFWWPVEREV